MIRAKKLATAKEKDMETTFPYDFVLLIDDDDITNFLNEDIIKSFNISPSLKLTKNVEEALEFLSHCYSNNKESSILVFLDLIMSCNSKDGFGFLKDLGTDPNIPVSHIDIIVLTNSLDAVHKQRAEKYNIMGYLAKPLSAEKITTSLGKKLNLDY